MFRALEEEHVVRLLLHCRRHLVDGQTFDGQTQGLGSRTWFRIQVGGLSLIVRVRGFLVSGLGCSVWGFAVRAQGLVVRLPGEECVVGLRGVPKEEHVVRMLLHC